MPTGFDAVAQDALVLPADQRLKLARRLLDSVELEPEPGAEAAWETKIARRIDRLDAGESKPIPATRFWRDCAGSMLHAVVA